MVVVGVGLFDGGAFCWTATEREGTELVVVVVLPLLLHAEDDAEGGRCE